MDWNANSLYLWFVVVFSLWMLYRSWKHRKEVEERKDIIKRLDAIRDAIEGRHKDASDHFDSVL